MRFKVLASNWQPKKLNNKGLESAMRHLLNKNGIFTGKYLIEISDPSTNRRTFTYTGGKKSTPRWWHQDSDGRPRIIVAWANKYPTDFRDAVTKKKIKVNPKDVVIFHNQDVEHKMPRKVKSSRSRWFVRRHLLIKEVPRNLFS